MDEDTVIRPRNLLLLILFAFGTGGVSAFGSAANVYVTSTGAAAGNCPSGSTTFAPAQFSNSSNWGSGANQIGPGTTVLLCGTITGTAGSTLLTLQSSGSSGNPITLTFDAGASLQAPYFSQNGALNVNGQTHITINGGTNGSIMAMANGTAGATNCPAGACTNQQSSQAIQGLNSNDLVENLNVGPMYVATSGDNAWNSLSVDCIDTGSNSAAPSNVTINNVVTHDCYTGVGFWFGGTGSNYTVSNSTMYNVCWGMDVIEGGGTYSNVNIFGNKIYNHANWSNSGAACHSNGLHLFQANNCSSCFVSGIFLYNNEWDGPGASDTTAQLQMDNNGGNAQVTNGWIFNNVFSWTSTDCNNTCDAQLGLWTGSGWSVYNNTFIGDATGNSPGAPLMSDNQAGVTLAFKNNVLTTSSMLMGFNSGLMLSGSPNYNVYANVGSSGGGGATCVFTGTFSSWQSCIGSAGDANSHYYATDPLPTCNSNSDCSNVIPLAGSTVIGAGENLYSTCNGQPNPGLGALCFDKAGNPRPSASNWDAGVFQSAGALLSTPALSPPTNLNAVVQ